jgi:DoxX-like family
VHSLLIHRTLTGGIALVWLANGLLCKVLHLVPRHEQIVARILGPTYAAPLTVVIGFSEVLMGVWILSGIWRRWNVAAQVLLVAAMNLLEFILAPDLLLWGHANAFFALLFIGVIAFNERLISKLHSS